MRRIVFVLLLTLLGSAAMSAQILPPDARQHFERGLEATRGAVRPSDLDAAIGEFRAAIAAEPKFALAWYNLGLVQDAAGKYRDAASSLRRYLGLSPGALDRVETRRLIVEIQTKADRSFSEQELGYILEGLLARLNRCVAFAGVKRDAGGDLLARTGLLYYRGPRGSELEQFSKLEFRGPSVTILSVLDICDPSNPGSCPRLVETKIEILSRNRANLVETISASTGAVSIAPTRSECVLESPEPIFGPINSVDKWDMTPLHNAIESRDHAEIRRLIAAGADPDRRTAIRGTPLDFAVLRNDLKAVEILLDAGANPDTRNEYGSTPFRNAFGRWEIVRTMLMRGADATQTTPRGDTLLHESSLSKAPSIANLLIDYGADPAAKNIDGNTPLHQLVFSDGAEELARLLISKGASPNSRNKNGETPTLFALQNGKLGLVSLFLAKGADVNERDQFGNPLLFRAIDSGNTDAVKLLLESGADLRSRGSANRTVLQAAIGSYAKNPLPVLELLLDSGVQIDQPDELGITPIARAADDGKLEIVRLLLRRGANPNVADPTLRWTALHRAVERGQLAIVKALVEGGANLGLRDFSDQTPVERVNSEKFPDLVKYFKEVESAPFDEEFDRVGGWSTGNDGEIKFGIENGKFFIDQPVTGVTWHYYTTHAINAGRDFTLEAKMKFVSGDANNFYGLMWARTDKFNYLFFGVTPSGHIGFRKWANGWSEVVNQPSSVVKKGMAENVIAVRKVGLEYIFLVNGTEVARAPFEPFAGRLGFHVNHYMRVEIDRLRLSYP